MTLNNKITMEDCYDRGFLMCFEQLKKKYLSRKTFCSLQHRSFLGASLGAEMRSLVFTDIGELIYEGNSCKFISKKYCFWLNNGP